MSPDLNDQLARIQALLSIETADTSAVLVLLQEFYSVLGPAFPMLPDPSTRFLELRKQFLQHGLESIEATNPELAAKLQELIDQHCEKVSIFI